MSGYPPHLTHSARTARSLGSRSILPIESAASGYVLVVEDDPLVSEVMADIVTSLGFSVLTAVDGAEGVSLYRGLWEKVLCIILDFEIPGMHSSRALSCFREINPKAKILLSSGYPESNIRREFPMASVDGFIPKPYDYEMLLEALVSMADKASAA